MNTTTIKSLFLSACVAAIAIAAEPTTSEVPVFGCLLAGADRLSREQSAFIPRTVLTEPGTLAGHWLSPSNTSSLSVSPVEDTSRKKGRKKSNPSLAEDFVLRLQAGTNVATREFTASYGPFRVYGIDADADGKDEIVLEYGEGRGTFVHVQKLEILTMSGKHFEPLFKADMNGYLWDPDQDDPLSWERTYTWKKLDGAGRFDLQLDLIPPASVPRYCGVEEDLMILQHPKVIYRLNSERCRFEIIQEEFRPLSSGGDGAPSPPVPVRRS